jgi:hypothetical protein
MGADNIEGREREYYKFITYKQNEELLHLRTKFNEVYYIVNLYCQANSSFCEFLYTNNEKLDVEAEKWTLPEYWAVLMNPLNPDEVKLLKRQIYFMYTFIIPKFPKHPNVTR